MSLATDLLQQAKHLAKIDERRPKQVSLRRAVSAGYYALFHLLTQAAAFAFFAKATGLRPLIRRTFTHAEMKDCCNSFNSPDIPTHLRETGVSTVPADLRFIAATFVELQEARHAADYKVNKNFTRRETKALIDSVDKAFQK